MTSAITTICAPEGSGILDGDRHVSGDKLLQPVPGKSSAKFTAVNYSQVVQAVEAVGVSCSR